MEAANGSAYESVSVIGHSLGGYSALRLAGAQPVLDGTLAAHCSANDDQVLCNGRAGGRFETIVASGDNFTDDRVVKVILLAPGYGPLFGQGPLAVEAGVLIVASSDDSELPGEQVENLIDRMGAGADASVVDGGHYVFLRPCTEAEAKDFPDICEDPDGVDRTAMHAELSDQIVTFIQS